MESRLQASPAVRVRGLVKRYGDLAALDGLSLEVPRGAFFAFLGPNGAGKSTTIGVLTGVREPDAGEVSILGIDALSRPLDVKARIGVVPEELALFERLTGRQHLVFCGRMYGLSRRDAQARADELLEVVDLSRRADARVAEYSKGMRRRLAIAAALMHAPELLFLDEPFEGIDVLASGVIRALLRELSRKGVTIVLTTHVLEIADSLATHAGVILGGRLLDAGPLPELCARHRVRNLTETFEALVGAAANPQISLSFYGSSRVGIPGEPA